MEDFNFNLELDESAQLRIDSLEFLRQTLDWGYSFAAISKPMIELMKALITCPVEEVDVEKLQALLPMAWAAVAQEVNQLYVNIQQAAVKINGRPFPMPNGGHHPECGEIEHVCGHEDHYPIS